MHQVSQIIIDDMRTKLELHDDNAHLQRWRKKHANEADRAPGRRGAYWMFANAAEARRRKLNQHLELPTRVQCIPRGPDDENSWRSFEALRQAICAVVEGEREVFLQTAEEVEAVAATIEACTSTKHPDEVGKGRKRMAGSRVMIDIAYI